MIKIIEGDLTKISVEAIVNAAGEMMLHGGGVARAIADAAGPELIKESREIIIERGPLNAGEAVYTSSGNLKEIGVRYVIHVVGPRGTNRELLEKAITSVFELAKELNLKSIAIPAVSCGIFGFDKKQGSEIIFDIVKKYEKDFEEICLVSRNKEIIGNWKKLKVGK